MCRREGLKLFLKGERCYTDKCAIERRNYPPGAHGQARTRFSEFAIRLREKQKVKRIYGMLEKQFAQYFEIAERMPGITGENLKFYPTEVNAIDRAMMVPLNGATTRANDLSLRSRSMFACCAPTIAFATATFASSTAACACFCSRSCCEVIP